MRVAHRPHIHGPREAPKSRKGVRGKPSATVLTPGKGWVLAILAMLALRAARGSGWLRSRPYGPPLPYAARRAVLKVSGRGA